MNVLNSIKPMKIFTIFSRLKFIISICFILFSFESILGQAIPIFPNPAGQPTLVSGTDLQPGAVYLYQDVALNVNGGTLDVDALFTIVNTIGTGTVNIIDRTLATTPINTENRFEPELQYNIDGDAITWQIEFIIAGTADTDIADAVPIAIDSYSLEIIDLDAGEFAEVLVPDSYVLEGDGSSIITDIPLGGGNILFQSANTTVVGIDPADTQAAVQVNYTNVSRVLFTLGRINIAPSLARDVSISFTGEVNFNIENTVVVNTPPVVINNTGNTVIENSTGNPAINVLTGATDAEFNLDTSTLRLLDPNDPTNIGVAGSPLVITGVGTYVIDNFGNVTFTPGANYSGSANINFVVEDLTGATSNVGTLFITVLGDNDGDGVIDTVDLDDDNDGIPDTDEFVCVPLPVASFLDNDNAVNIDVSEVNSSILTLDNTETFTWSTEPVNANSFHDITSTFISNTGKFIVYQSSNANSASTTTSFDVTLTFSTPQNGFVLQAFDFDGPTSESISNFNIQPTTLTANAQNVNGTVTSTGNNQDILLTWFFESPVTTLTFTIQRPGSNLGLGFNAGFIGVFRFRCRQ